MKPYVPSLSRTPARTTLPAVGASVWARGSQVCSGNSGVLTANVTNMAMNVSVAASPVSGGAAMTARMSKVRGWPPR